MLAYCDFIADRIRKGLINSMNDALEPVRLTEVTRPAWDLGPNGEFASTKKTISVTDGNGKRYVVTVEEA
jgi:hypothetical protein